MQVEIDLNDVTIWLDTWYTSKNYFCVCKVSHINKINDKELMIYLTNGRGVLYKDFYKEYEPTETMQLYNIQKGIIK